MPTAKTKRRVKVHGCYTGLTVGAIVGMFGFAMIRLRYDLFVYPKK